jgi:succinate dehydrogenase/fumarate reductase flavoprotein subunit
MTVNIKRSYTTDVLVVGHGIAGLAAAITVKEENPSLKVLTVDKNCIGYAGKAPRGGGHVAFIPEGAEETYVEYHTKNLGDYLNDQDMLRKYADNTRKTLARWESWGVKYILPLDQAKNAHAIIPWKITIVDLDMTIHMANHAKKIGVESMEKISITDFLTHEGRVVGAIGFDLLSGDPIVISAKSVILASGNQNWGVMRMWASGKGDGVAAAWRAGARVRNCEFGSFINIINKASYMCTYGSEDVLYNADGKSLNNRAGLDESLQGAVLGGVDLGGDQAVLMYIESREGRGPIYENTSENHLKEDYIGRNFWCLDTADPECTRPVAQKFWDRLNQKNHGGAPGHDEVMQEAVPGLIGEMSPVYVDHDMFTRVPGLYACGDVCANGSSWSGAVPTPPGRNRGSGLVHAVWSAIIAGESVAKATDTYQPILSDVQVQEICERIFKPLNNGGSIDSIDMKWELQNIMQPVAYTGYKSEDRMTEALNKVLDLKAKLPLLKATDPHELMSANECVSTVLCAELFFRSSLARKESRGWHMREDYKEKNNKDYLKWIVMHKGNNDEVVLEWEDVPMDGYKYKPE